MRTLTALLVSIILLTFYGNAIGQNTTDIFKILKKLEAKATVGTTYGDYTNAVAEAKVEVDSFVESKDSLNNPSFRKYVREVMAFYVIAAQSWNDVIKSQTRIEVMINKLPLQAAWNNASRVLKEAEKSLTSENNNNLSNNKQYTKPNVQSQKIEPRQVSHATQKDGHDPIE